MFGSWPIRPVTSTGFAAILAALALLSQASPLAADGSRVGVVSSRPVGAAVAHAVLKGAVGHGQPWGFVPQAHGTAASTASLHPPGSSSTWAGPTPTPPPTATATPPTNSAVQLAEQDLANRLGVPVSDISVVSVNSVSWPDSSLGLPQPGMAYSQMVTPGYNIQLQVNNQTYDYHSDSGTRVAYGGSSES
jgi:hypothetical protein